MTDETLWIVTANEISKQDEEIEGTKNLWNNPDSGAKETIEDVESRQVSLQKLGEELSKFFKVFSGVFDRTGNAIPAETGVKLGEIELSVEITGEGDIKLLGTGIKAGTKGGLTLKFKKNVHNQFVDKRKTNFTEDLGDGTKLEMVYIPAGEFMMGSNESKYEQPIHKVTFEQGFHIGKYPITQAQYQAIMGTNPSYFQNKQKAPLSNGGWGDHPVEKVSWHDAQEFCQKLSAKTGKKYKLPSESQWEYACRSGSQTKWCFGDDRSKLTDYAWYGDNSGENQLDTLQMLRTNSNSYYYTIMANKCQTHPVGQKNPNNWGLYDMHGNVWEWCEHNYDWDNDGTAKLEQNPHLKIIRGGSWDDNPLYSRSACRRANPGGDVNFSYGFRVVCD